MLYDMILFNYIKKRTDIEKKRICDFVKKLRKKDC